MRRQILPSLQKKILGVGLLTTLVALVVALTAFVTYNVRSDLRILIDDLTTQSELLGHMTEPALAFDDKKLATQNLNLLRFRPAVRAAAIYNAKGVLFAKYAVRGESLPFPGIPETDGVRVQGKDLIIFKRIVNDQEIIGTVYVHANYELLEKLKDYIGISAVAMIIALLAAFLLSLRLQKIVSGPVLAIAGVAREVVEQRDYSRRAEKISDDEVGVLVESFNDMLAEIERRTQDLESSNHEIAREAAKREQAQQEVMRLNEQLEQRVRERTAQLESINGELVMAKATAEKANHAKSAFLSGMSHELRTPLNAILGFAQLLSSQTTTLSLEKRNEFALHILKAGQHLLVLINEVLDLAKVESGALTLSLESVSLSDVMRECREMTESLASKRNIRMIFPQDGSVYVVADRTRLKQVILNLLSNAIKYNRDGGTVIVGCSTHDSGRLRISVQDTGAGLEAEQTEQLFQPFNRLGQEGGSEEGSGIGLVVTKKLVELMEGKIGVTSTVGIGSVFWVELNSANPIRFGTGSNIAKLVPVKNPGPSDNSVHTLLYVEDNPANLKLVQEIIGCRSDLRLITAMDGNRGVELARTHLPDIILMDINLPGMSGNNALKILRKEPTTAHIPVIALTANAMPRDVKKSIEAGFFRYLTKPINVDELVEALESALSVAGNSVSQNKRT